MSEEPSQGRAGWVLIAWAVVPALLLIGVVAATLLQAPAVVPPKEGGGPGEVNELAAARSALVKQNDLTACKAAVGRLNSHLRQASEHAVPEMAAADLARLRAEMKLGDADAEEVTSATFTALDAHHLETCFLLRDAAASLELTVPGAKGTPPVRLTPLARAEAAFAWVCRQVRLQPGADAVTAPPGIALRRGWGGALERGLVFLALLEQFGLDEGDAAGLQGCLLYLPGGRLWACGVVTPAKPDTLYLFDPRLGLALPGPGGKGVATLAEARADPKVLAQLDAGGQKYDADAAKAEARLVVPLSGSAPRMLLLQDVLLREREWRKRPLPAPVRVKLAESASVARATIEAAAKGHAVRLAPELGLLLRRSLPKADGGDEVRVEIDPARQLPGFVPPHARLRLPLTHGQFLQLSAIPWTSFPAEFSDPNQFNLNFGIGRDLRQFYSGPFVRAMSDPSSPREAVLRGRVGRVTSEQLVKEREHWNQTRLLGLTDEDRRGLREWAEKVNQAQARDLPAAEVAKLFQFRPDEPMGKLMGRAIGEPRAMELTYQLGLCMQERAERAAGRAALAAGAGQKLADEEAGAKEAYQAAAGWWGELLDLFPDAPTTPAGRRLRGEALWALGKQKEAREAWKDVPRALDDVEKLAGPWLSRAGR